MHAKSVNGGIVWKMTKKTYFQRLASEKNEQKTNLVQPIFH